MLPPSLGARNRCPSADFEIWGQASNSATLHKNIHKRIISLYILHISLTNDSQSFTGQTFTNVPGAAFSAINQWIGVPDLTDLLFVAADGSKFGPPVIPCDAIPQLLAEHKSISFLFGGKPYSQDANTYINRVSFQCQWWDSWECLIMQIADRQSWTAPLKCIVAIGFDSDWQNTKIFKFKLGSGNILVSQVQWDSFVATERRHNDYEFWSRLYTLWPTRDVACVQ